MFAFREWLHALRNAFTMAAWLFFIVSIAFIAIGIIIEVVRVYQ